LSSFFLEGKGKFWGFNSGPCTCLASTPPLELYPTPFCFLVCFSDSLRGGLGPWFSYLCLLSSLDYRPWSFTMNSFQLLNPCTDPLRTGNFRRRVGAPFCLWKTRGSGGEITYVRSQILSSYLVHFQVKVQAPSSPLMSSLKPASGPHCHPPTRATAVLISFTTDCFRQWLSFI
jgi:hypothetical protein